MPSNIPIDGLRWGFWACTPPKQAPWSQKNVGHGGPFGQPESVPVNVIIAVHLRSLWGHSFPRNSFVTLQQCRSYLAVATLCVMLDACTKEDLPTMRYTLPHLFGDSTGAEIFGTSLKWLVDIHGLRSITLMTSARFWVLRLCCGHLISSSGALWSCKPEGQESANGKGPTEFGIRGGV